MNIFAGVRCLTNLVLLGLCLGVSSVCAQPQTLTLLGRSSVDGYTARLSEADARWLRQKGRLVLAVSAPDYPPFDITTSGDAFEGLTADYAGLLQQLLHVEIDVQRYPSRKDAVQAIKQGAADLLGTANSFEAEDPELCLSSAYAVDQPVLVTRTDSPQPLDPELAVRGWRCCTTICLNITCSGFIPGPMCNCFPRRWRP